MISQFYIAYNCYEGEGLGPPLLRLENPQTGKDQRYLCSDKGKMYGVVKWENFKEITREPI